MSTSVAGLSSDPNAMYKKSFHWTNDSGELDVFEAARYFSSANDQFPGYLNSVNFPQKFIREADRQNVQRPARRSLDMPMRSNLIPAEYHVLDQKQIKENKKYKQPSSPGGRLASFLNSLFNQTHLKKKKSKSGGTTKDIEEESPGGRRKRRSSISHFRITSNTASAAANNDSKSLYSSSNSGFRTPPPYANTPTKSYKEFRKISDQAISLPKNSKNSRPTLLDELHAEKKCPDYAWREEKFRTSNGIPGKIQQNGNFGFSNPTSNPSEEREFRKFNEADDGADSDSSSDLFDLPNHDLDFFSSGLPVYETTHMDKIKIGTPISSATVV